MADLVCYMFLKLQLILITIMLFFVLNICKQVGVLKTILLKLSTAKQKQKPKEKRIGMAWRKQRNCVLITTNSTSSN